MKFHQVRDKKILLAKELINQPSVILMDEPFTHLDPFMRVSILSDLFRYIKSREMTVIWVTHDLNEALKFSNKIAVMNFGKFEQFGSPIEIMKSPKNLFVAKFLGYKNFFAIKEHSDKWSTPWGERPKSEKYSEGILVVPDHAWIMGDGVLVTYLETIVAIQSLIFVMDYEGREIFWQRSITEADTFKTAQLCPLWIDCFIIPL